MKSGSLKFLESSGPVQACNGIAFYLQDSRFFSPEPLVATLQNHTMSPSNVIVLFELLVSCVTLRLVIYGAVRSSAGDRIPSPGGSNFLRICENWYKSDRMRLRNGADVLIKLDGPVAVQPTFIFVSLSHSTNCQ